MNLTTNRRDAARFVIRTDALHVGREFKRRYPEDVIKASIVEAGSRYYIAIESPIFRGWIAQ